MKSPIKTISIIGSGNVAFHLASVFCSKGISVKEIVGRNKDKVRDYATQFDSKPVFDTQEISLETDLVIIAVSDYAISEIANSLQLKDLSVVHTSGSVALNSLQNISSQIGVFYPLQTFSTSTPTDFSNLPICIESSNNTMQEKLKDLAMLVTNKVYFLDSEQRRNLHVAAVISNNFINYLLSSTFDFLEKHKINKEILIPLVDETFKRIKNNSTKDLQTGPARRNDRETIQAHLEILKTSPELYDIYKMMSNEILIKYHGNRL